MSQCKFSSSPGRTWKLAVKCYNRNHPLQSFFFLNGVPKRLFSALFFCWRINRSLSFLCTRVLNLRYPSSGQRTGACVKLKCEAGVTACGDCPHPLLGSLSHPQCCFWSSPHAFPLSRSNCISKYRASEGSLGLGTGMAGVLFSTVGSCPFPDSWLVLHLSDVLTCAALSYWLALGYLLLCLSWSLAIGLLFSCLDTCPISFSWHTWAFQIYSDPRFVFLHGFFKELPKFLPNFILCFL